MNLTVKLADLDDNGRYLATLLPNDGDTVHIDSNTAVHCRDKLTFRQRAKRFGLTCPVPDLDAYLQRVERMYGIAGQDRHWKVYHLPGWQSMNDTQRVNALGAELRRFCEVGEFEPQPHTPNPLTERVLDALFGRRVTHHATQS